MTITNKLKLDLQQKGQLQRIDAVQGDTFTRQVNLLMQSGGEDWMVPPDCEMVVRYCKADGTAGIYDTLPDGRPGILFGLNTITVELAPQMLTCPGVVQVQVELLQQEQKLATFPFLVVVEPGVAPDGESEDYVNWSKAFLPQTLGAKVGQYLQIAEVDDAGRIMAVASSEVADGAIEEVANAAMALAEASDTKAATAMQIAQNVAQEMEAYSPSGTRSIAEAAMRMASERLVAPAVATVGQYLRVAAVDANGMVTAVDATFGGDVDQSGLTIKEKSLMLTLFKNMLSQNNMSDTVNELEKIWTSGDSGEEEPDTTKTYTIKYNLSNVVSSNSDASITGGESFTATLDATENHKLDNVVVTMGGIDVTDSVYADGVITITAVTGNIVINASASELSGATNWTAGVPYVYTVIENEYVDTDGSFKQYEGADYKRSDYIPCYGVDYISASMLIGDATAKVFFYDGNKKYLSSITAHGASRVRVPENAAYFVLSRGNVGKYEIKPGVDPAPVWENGVPYTLTPFVVNEYVSGGNFLSYVGWSRTEHINCAGASRIEFNAAVTQYSSFYDSNKDFVAPVTTADSDNNSAVVPEYASYFVVSKADAEMAALTATPYKEG